MLERVHGQQQFDLLIIGGGIHGASLLRQASIAGLRALLLERDDIGGGISSRSSKMLHGGVRYLEQGHVRLVKEALAERAYQLLQAPHLCRPQRFLLPITPRSKRPAWQVRFGLFLYDALGRIFQPLDARAQAKMFTYSRWLSQDSPQSRALANMGLPFSCLLQYADGQMDDTRLVFENCLDAVDLGGYVLPAAEVISFFQQGSIWQITWRDKLSEREHTSKARAVVNLTGPAVLTVHQRWQAWPETWPRPLYARGTHLLFDFPWESEGLIVPTKEANRYYFIWPYFSAAGKATLVGPTSVACEHDEYPCNPTSDEIDELLAYLKEDFPHVSFRKSTLLHSFAGMRVLAGPPAAVQQHASGKSISSVSREDAILQKGTYVTLLGGKYTTARKTAERILLRVCRSLHLAVPTKAHRAEFRQRLLPGAKGLSPKVEKELKEKLRSHFSLEISSEVEAELESTVARFGSRAELLLRYEPEPRLSGIDQLVQAITRYCIECEWAYDPFGVAHRLGWDDFPGRYAQHKQQIENEFL